MKITDLSRNIEVILAAPNGLAHLKSLILDLAFSGALLDGKIQPPELWEKLTLEKACDYIQRGKSPSYADFGKCLVVSQRCVHWSGFRPEHARFIEDSTIEKYSPDRFLKEGDILWNSTGTGTVGRTTIFTPEEKNVSYVADSHVTVLRASRIESKFLHYWSRSPKVQDIVLGLTTGSTNQQELNLSTIKSLEISFPSKSHQALLSNHIDNLIGICETLDASIKASEKLSSLSRKSAVDAVSTAQTPAELHIAWERIQKYWEVIAGTPEAIDSLKTLILDLAVRGELIPVGHSNDARTIEWTHSELKLDESKLWNLPTLHKEIRSGWNRIPMAKLGSWGSGGTPTSTRKEFYQNGTIPWAVIGDLNNETMFNTETKITEQALQASSSKIIPVGAVLIAMYGASIGKTAISGIECCTNQAIAHCIVDKTIVSTDYFFLVAKSLKRYLVQEGKGAAQPNISQSVLKHLIIDLPSLAEQELIVSKVNSLFQVCTDLSAAIEVSESIAEKFARSIASTLVA